MSTKETAITEPWVSCKSQLPKDSESVLVCFIDEFDDGSAKFPNWGIGIYGEIEQTWYVDGWAEAYVVAWMPLPELPQISV